MFGGIILQKLENYTKTVRICTIPHDILTSGMNKALPQILFPLFILATILAFTLALSPSASGSAANFSAVHHAALRVSAPTPTPTAQNISHPGSTNGLVIMSFAIVLIIILPILFQKNLWTK